MESINGGELFTHLRRARKFSDEQSKFYALQAPSEVFFQLRSLGQEFILRVAHELEMETWTLEGVRKHGLRAYSCA